MFALKSVCPWKLIKRVAVIWFSENGPLNSGFTAGSGGVKTWRYSPTIGNAICHVIITCIPVLCRNSGKNVHWNILHKDLGLTPW